MAQASLSLPADNIQGKKNIMNKLTIMNAQADLQTNSRLAKILADRRATLARKEDKKA